MQTYITWSSDLTPLGGRELTSTVSQFPENTGLEPLLKVSELRATTAIVTRTWDGKCFMYK